MKLLFSVAARNRNFGKAMRRVGSSFDSLRGAFSRIELRHPIHDTILVGLTDDLAPEYYEKVLNKNGCFQVLLGCPLGADDDDLKRAVFERLKRAVLACPFSSSDKVAFEKLFREWERVNFAM